MDNTTSRSTTLRSTTSILLQEPVASLQISRENTTRNVSRETHEAPHPFRSEQYNPLLHQKPLNSL